MSTVGSKFCFNSLNLISFKQIITSRLAIVLYRLRYFDLDASIVSIGRFFSDSSGKSKPFKINLNRNSDGYFFTDLNNKIFRGVDFFAACSYTFGFSVLYKII